MTGGLPAPGRSGVEAIWIAAAAVAMTIAMMLLMLVTAANAAPRVFVCKRWVVVPAVDFVGGRVRRVPICDTRVR
jgi:hypothetical protein